MTSSDNWSLLPNCPSFSESEESPQKSSQYEEFFNGLLPVTPEENDLGSMKPPWLRKKTKKAKPSILDEICKTRDEQEVAGDNGTPRKVEKKTVSFLRKRLFLSESKKESSPEKAVIFGGNFIKDTENISVSSSSNYLELGSESDSRIEELSCSLDSSSVITPNFLMSTSSEETSYFTSSSSSCFTLPSDSATSHNPSMDDSESPQNYLNSSNSKKISTSTPSDPDSKTSPLSWDNSRILSKSSSLKISESFTRLSACLAMTNSSLILTR